MKEYGVSEGIAPLNLNLAVVRWLPGLFSRGQGVPRARGHLCVLSDSNHDSLVAQSPTAVPHAAQQWSELQHLRRARSLKNSIPSGLGEVKWKWSWEMRLVVGNFLSKIWAAKTLLMCYSACCIWSDAPLNFRVLALSSCSNTARQITPEFWMSLQ
jgi:hypothetical protein